MRKSAVVSLLVISAFVLAAAPTQAWGDWHGRVFVGVGPGFWWGAPYPYWWYAPPYYAYPPPQVIVQQPPVYVQREPSAPEASWYYCESAKGYYPYVQTCPEEWVKVPTRPE